MIVSGHAYSSSDSVVRVQIWTIFRHRGDPRVSTAVGLKEEAGTRRFSGVDKKELLYREGVRNAEYKRQLGKVGVPAEYECMATRY